MVGHQLSDLIGKDISELYEDMKRRKREQEEQDRLRNERQPSLAEKSDETSDTGNNTRSFSQ